jgi:hypothetical protein
MLAVLSAAPLLVARPLLAQSSGDEAKAEKQFRDGRDAMKAGDLQRARALFLSSQDLYPTVGTLLNLATCEEQLGLFASAWKHFNEVLAMLPPEDRRAPTARQRAAAIEPRVPRLRIELAPGAPATMRIALDDRALPATEIGVDLRLDPGEHTLVANAPERKDQRYSVTLSEGRRETVEVTAGPPVPSRVEPPAVGPAPGTGEEKSDPVRTAGWVIGGVGLAAAGAGAVTGGLAVRKKSDLDGLCPMKSQCGAEGLAVARDGAAFGNASTALLAVGLAATLTGATILLVRTSKGADVKASALPGGLMLHGRF